MFQLLLLGSYFYSSKSTKDENNRPRSSMNFDSEIPQQNINRSILKMY